MSWGNDSIVKLNLVDVIVKIKYEENTGLTNETRGPLYHYSMCFTRHFRHRPTFVLNHLSPAVSQCRNNGSI